MDIAKFKYLLEVHGVSKQDLIDTQDWGVTTYYRKISGESDWTISEVNNLIKLGFELTEIIDIFFKVAVTFSV